MKKIRAVLCWLGLHPRYLKPTKYGRAHGCKPVPYLRCPWCEAYL